GSSDEQTGQSQPSTGTPLDVPLPRITRRRPVPGTRAAALVGNCSKPQALPSRFAGSTSTNRPPPRRPGPGEPSSIVRPRTGGGDPKFPLTPWPPCLARRRRVKSLARIYMQEGFQVIYVQGRQPGYGDAPPRTASSPAHGARRAGVHGEGC